MRVHPAYGLFCCVVVLGLVGLGPADVHAQTKTVTGTGTVSASVGLSFAAAGDVNGDGVADVLAGNPNINFSQERVILFSGADGSILHVFATPTHVICFAQSTAGGKDIDGDGVPDILIGAHCGSTGNPSPGSLGNGSVFVYSGASKALIREHVGTAGQFLGFAVAFLDDMNGDGVAEYGAGAIHSIINPLAGELGPDSHEPGEAFIYSGRDGQLLYALGEGAAGSAFGCSLQAIGDADGDGVSDFVVGACGTSTFGWLGNGAVYLFSGSSGLLIREDHGTNQFAQFGRALAAMGDIDGDSRADYASTWFLGTNGAVVVSGGSGAILTQVVGPFGAFFNASSRLASIADLDGDGKREMLVANVGTSDSNLMVANGDTGETLYIIPDDDPTVLGFPGSVMALGDLDGDGLEEIGVSNAFAGENGGGQVYAYSVRSLYALETELPASAGISIPLDLNGGVPCAGATYFLLMGVSGARPGFDVGSTHVPLNIDEVTRTSVNMANLPPFINTFGTLDDVTGKATAAFDLSGVVLPPAAIGVSLYFAYAAQCSGGPWDFASNPETVLIVP